jgi:hypothetical protein
MGWLKILFFNLEGSLKKDSTLMMITRLLRFLSA